MIRGKMSCLEFAFYALLALSIFVVTWLVLTYLL